MQSFRLITPPPYSFVELIPPHADSCALLLISCAPSAQAERDPTSPSSQPYTSSHSKRTKPVEKAQRLLEGEWGEGVFNQGLDPMKLHRPERNEGVAIFAGGCFWCMEAPFEKLEGVVAVYSGYTGGESASPTYGQVSASRTQHLEAVIVYYRPKLITYETLLHHYWRHQPGHKQTGNSQIVVYSIRPLFYCHHAQRGCRAIEEDADESLV